MLQNPRKTLGYKKNMVYKIPPGGGGKPYPASGLFWALWRPGGQNDFISNMVNWHIKSTGMTSRTEYKYIFTLWSN